MHRPRAIRSWVRSSSTYSVYFGEAQFTVTEPNDMVFLDYFLKRVFAADGPPELPRRPGLMQRLFGWMVLPA